MRFRDSASTGLILLLSAGSNISANHIHLRARLRPQWYVRKNGGKMQILLIVAIVLIALAVSAQTGVLIAMYLMSRRISEKAEVLMNETRGPLESIIGNLKTVSYDLSETGKIARAQAQHIQESLVELRQGIREQIGDVRGTVEDTVTDARHMILRPLREYSAIAVGIAEGIRTFFLGRKRKETQVEMEPKRKHPAA